MTVTWKAGAALIAACAALGACGVVESAESLIESDVNSDEGWTSSWAGEPFDSITVAGPDDLDFTTGAHAVTASGDPKAIEALQFKVKDGALSIRRKPSNWSLGRSKGEATVKVSAPALRALALAGSGAAKVDRMAGDSVKLSIAGSGDADIAQIVTKTLKGSIAGSGSIRLAGSADAADISIAGSGSVLGEGFTSDAVDISIAGSGDVTMASDGAVDASLMGSGDVTIKGSAKCKSKAMGSGSMSCG
ncbi:head GIN domain-containing protein [Blastomonas sp.]|uniref:head GIN domain-containing protein n=1 Tax=Blastomonas sp. TaxID=1909299 RepID=UPI0035930644